MTYIYLNIYDKICEYTDILVCNNNHRVSMHCTSPPSWFGVLGLYWQSCILTRVTTFSNYFQKHFCKHTITDWQQQRHSMAFSCRRMQNIWLGWKWLCPLVPGLSTLTRATVKLYEWRWLHVLHRCLLDIAHSIITNTHREICPWLQRRL